MKNKLAAEIIRKCQEEQSDFLDLGNCGLTEVPEEVFEMTHLRRLNLGQRFYNNRDWINTKNEGNYNQITKLSRELYRLQNLKELSLEGNPIMDGTIISEIPDLERLNIGSTEIKSLNFIKNFSKLESLNVKNLQLKSLENITKTGLDFTNLKSLDISENYLQKIEKLENFPQLESLNLSINHIREIQGLDSLKHLKSLYLGLNWITKIKNLHSLSQLEILSLGYLGVHIGRYLISEYYRSNLIKEIENLESLTQLRKLDLSGNLITKIDALFSQTELNTLYLGHNQIKSLTNISHLKKLKSLCLGYRTPDFIVTDFLYHQLFKNYCLFANQITVTESLKHFRDLECLSLDHNQISDANSLTELKKLKYLYLDFNQIEEIGNIGSLYNLEYLSLNSNRINKITSLSQLSKLQHLSLNSNQLSNVNDLESLVNLKKLYLGDNQIVKIQGLEKLINLQVLHLESNEISEIEGLATLSCLEELTLDSNQIKEIKNLEYLVNLKYLSLDSNQISEIKNLEALIKLQALTLRSNQIEEIKNLETLSSLHHLSLDSNQIKEVKNLENLSGLQELFLDSNQVKEIKNLEALINLQYLSLDSNRILEIKNLEALVNLYSLNLGSNQISEIKNLESLVNLQNLWLASNQIEKIENLDTLSNLRNLWIPSNRIIEIKNLESLTLLQRLSLSSNQIEKIENLDLLSNLQYLWLSYNQIKEIENLDALINLEYLWLSYNEIKRINNLNHLINLQYLSLDSNKIAKIENINILVNLLQLSLDSNLIIEIENLEGLSKLKKIDLNDNNIKEIPNLKYLPNLQHLCINKNNILKTDAVKNMPLLAELQLSENCLVDFDIRLFEGKNMLRLFLSKNKFVNIPSEITNLENCLLDARAWFKDLEQESIENFEAKLMLVGNGRVGKTSILRRLFQDQFDPHEDSTHGIQLYKQEVKMEFFPFPLRIQAWDFGGQEIYHATHRLFMQSRALYLVLWDWATEHQAFSTENIAGEPVQFRNYELTYWLDHARSLSWQSPLIVVQNKIDQHQRKWPKHLNELQERYNVISFYHVSAATGEGMPVLLSAVLEEFRKMPEVGMKTPGQWLRVKGKLLALKAGNQTIDFSLYQAICQEEGLKTASINALIRFLHNTGNLFYQSDLFQNQIILDQEWALEGMYALFQRGPFYKQLKFSGGRTSLDVLEWPWQNYDLNTRKIFLSMMESCEICFKITEDERDPEYIIMEFLPDQKDDKVASFWEKSTENELYLKYQTNFFHPAFISRFIARAGRLAKSFDHIWCNGIWITFENAHALIEAYPDEHQIQIRVKGEPGILLLYLIHNAFREIFYEPDSVQMNVSVAGKDFLRYQELKDGKVKGMKKVLSNSHKMVDLEKVEFFSEVLDARSEDDVKQLADIVPKPKIKTSSITDLTAALSAEALENLNGKLKNELGHDLKKAIESINSILRNGDLKNQLITIQGRYANLEKFMNLGKLDFKEYDQNCSQIRSALIELVDDIEGQDIEMGSAMAYLG